MKRPFGKRTVIGTAVLLICSLFWSSAAAARVVETVHDGVIILFIEKPAADDPGAITSRQFFAKILESLEILRREAPDIYRKIKALHGRAVIKYDPDHPKDKFAEVGLAKFETRTGIKKYDSLPGKRYVAVLGRFLNKYSAREVAGTIVHELIGHGRQYRENRLYDMRALDRECEARLLEIDAFQKLEFDKFSEQMISFRKLLENKYCYDYKQYTLKCQPELGKLWKLRHLPVAPLLKVFKPYLMIEPWAAGSRPSSDPDYDYYDYDFYVTVHRC